MSDYGLFFTKGKTTYRLPVNPETIEVSSSMATEEYQIVRGEKILVPSSMELKEVTFECEFPSVQYMYVENKKKFKDCAYYEDLFDKWRNKLTPVRFTMHNGVGGDISMMVLITELTITESAGEEGDKNFSFTLKEYKDYSIMEVSTKKKKNTKKTKKANDTTTNPNNKGTYVVVKGDSLWKISKRFYGDASHWKKIYNANKDKIKNPNLIYPKQTLVIPQ